MLRWMLRFPSFVFAGTGCQPAIPLPHPIYAVARIPCHQLLHQNNGTTGNMRKLEERGMECLQGSIQ